MKARHADWAKLTAQPKPKTPATAVRIANQPGVEELERKLLLYTGRRGELSPEMDALIDGVSLRLFEITSRDTAFNPPGAYWDLSEDDPQRWQIETAWDAYDRQFKSEHLPDEEALSYLRALGVDFAAPGGGSLRCMKYLGRQAEAAASGVKGRLPDPVEVDVDRLASDLEAQARAWKSKRIRG